MLGLVEGTKAHFNVCNLSAGSYSQEDDTPKIKKVVEIIQSEERDRLLILTLMPIKDI